MDCDPNSARFFLGSAGLGRRARVEEARLGDWLITADGRFRCQTIIITAVDGEARREIELPMGSARMVSQHRGARCDCGSRRVMMKGRGGSPTWAQCYDCDRVEEFA